MAKKSSYRRMKDRLEKEITSLRKDLMTISSDINSEDAVSLIDYWKTMKSIEDAGAMYVTNDYSEILNILAKDRPTGCNVYHSFENSTLSAIENPNK